MKKKNKKVNKKLGNTQEVVEEFEILRIDWFDHFSGNKQWSAKSELNFSLPICTTVGMKVHEDKKSITLAMNASSFQHLADTTTIIKSCIDDIVKLGKVKYVLKETKAA